MKNTLYIIVLALAVSPAHAQFADLNAVALKDVRTVSVPEMKQPPAPAGRTAEKGLSQGTHWFHYETAGTSEQDGSSVQMDFMADEASNMNYHHYSFGRLIVRFYTSTDIEDPAKVYLSFKPGDQGMNYNVPKTIKKAMTHAKD
ncbi:MAG TPA: hypothetical protein PL037_08185, partial [Elusimicrobiales bacterium]|nr:hypothetical protein [Elusimicrobiales bacterium]